MLNRNLLPFGAQPKAPLVAESVIGIGGEIGKAIVLKDTNGAPLFRLALDQITTTQPGAHRLDESTVELTSTDYGLVLTLFAPITFRPMPFPR